MICSLRTQDPDDLYFLPNAIKGSKQFLEVYFLQLLKLQAVRPYNVSRVLRLFCQMVIHNDDFDRALIELLKQVVHNYIRLEEKKSWIGEESKGSVYSLAKAIQHAHNMPAERFRTQIVLKDEEAVDDIIYRVAAIAFGVPLNMYWREGKHEAQGLLYNTQAPVQPQGHPHAALQTPLQDKPICLLRRGCLYYDVVYAESTIRDYPVLGTYDEDLDALPVIAESGILKPLCCLKGYDLLSYHRTMIALQGRVTRKCVICPGELDDIAYKQLTNVRNYNGCGSSFLFVLIVSVYIVSLLFVLSHAFS